MTRSGELCKSIIYPRGATLSSGVKMARKQRKRLPKKKSEAEIAWEKIRRKYPNCTGSYPECPEKIEDRHSPPAECLTCPVYAEWRR